MITRYCIKVVTSTTREKWVTLQNRREKPNEAVVVPARIAAQGLWASRWKLGGCIRQCDQASHPTQRWYHMRRDGRMVPRHRLGWLVLKWAGALSATFLVSAWLCWEPGLSLAAFSWVLGASREPQGLSMQTQSTSLTKATWILWWGKIMFTLPL